MSDISPIEEFLRRKSDGIGMSERYPKTAEALNDILDLLPEAVWTFDDAAVAGVIGRGVAKGVAWSEHAANVVLEGALTPIKASISGLVGEEIKDRLIAAVSVVATLGIHHAIKSGSEAMHDSDADWHLRHGVDIRPGSDLHKHIEGRPQPDLNPFRISPEEFAAIKAELKSPGPDEPDSTPEP